MPAAPPHATEDAPLRVEDGSDDPAAARRTPDAPLAVELGFRRLGTARLWVPEGELAGWLEVPAHVSRYGDAFAFPDPTDDRVRLRLVSVLTSGVMVESIVLDALHAAPPPPVRPPSREPPPPPPPEPEGPPESRELLADLGVEVTPDGTKKKKKKRRTGRSTSGTARLEAWLDQSGHLPWLDDLLDRVDLLPIAAHYPSMPQVGVHRQLLDMQDPASVWVAHRGLLRRIQGATGEVADHQSLPLFLATLRRLDHVARTQQRELGRMGTQGAEALQNLLLVAPALLGLVWGLPWWAAGLLAGFTAVASLAIVHALRTPPLRAWLISVPPLALGLGYFTLGGVAIFAILLWGVAVVLVRGRVLRALATEVWARYKGDAASEPAPVPMPALLEVYR